MKVPNESLSSSSDNSLNRSRSESSSSIRTGFDSIGTCSSIIGQVDSSKISSELSSHCFHSNPKHLCESFFAIQCIRKFFNQNCRKKVAGNTFINLSNFVESFPAQLFS